MYHALALRAPLPAAPACAETVAVLKPLPPRNWPWNPRLRAVVMILAGIAPSEVMKITSGLACTASVTNGERSAAALLKGIVLVSVMLYWPTVFWTILPPSLENLSSLATSRTPVLGWASLTYDLMLSGIAVSSPRLSLKTYW